MAEQSDRVVIVGASAAGLRCAARLKRLQPERPITVIEKSQVMSVAACGMPYVLSGDIPDRAALLKTAEGVVRDVSYFAAAKGVEVLAGARATRIDVEKKTLHVSGPQGEQELAWGDLVLATGGHARKLPGQPEHPRVRAFHCYDDIAPLDEGLKKGTIERVVIVGAGLVGCELAESFKAMWDAEVCLLEAGPWPLPAILDAEAAAIVTKELAANEVEFHCGAAVTGIEADDDGVRVSAGDQEFAGDVVVVAFGVAPAVELAKQAGVKLGPTGAIEVDERLATSVPKIWAAGDCVELIHAVTGQPAHRPLGSLANRQGRTLGNLLAGRPDHFGPVVGAGAIKVFDQNVACAGLTLHQAQKEFPKARAIWTSPEDAAHYWPEAKTIHLQLVYDAESRRVLGVQAIGPGECAKRIDEASQLLLRQVDLAEFSRLEHAYAPPYAPAMEPMAQAAMVAENQLDGVEPVGPLTDLAGLKLLDVRGDEEIAQYPLSGPEVTHLDQLEVRENLADLDAGPWTVVCARGVRSAEVARLLVQNGISATYLGGGIAWLLAAGRL